LLAVLLLNAGALCFVKSAINDTALFLDLRVALADPLKFIFVDVVAFLDLGLESLQKVEGLVPCPLHGTHEALFFGDERVLQLAVNNV